MSGLHDLRARLVGEPNLLAPSELYHENSKILPVAPGVAQSVESALVAPSGFKTYRYGEHTALPAPRTAEAAPILSALEARRSCRLYADRPIDLGAVSELLHYSFGIIDGRFRRCTPSAGGLYPLELYLVAARVESLGEGLYHYDVRGHRLDDLESGDFRPRLERAIFIEEAARTAAAVLILTGVFGRSKIKYGERAYRFVLLEAGHAMQNLCTTAAVLGLGTCPVGGFVDDELNDLLDVDGVDEAALYAVTIGHPA